jgi:hypothetical protein
MTSFRSLTCAALFLITCNAIAADPTLPELFKHAKDTFAAGDYKSSLAYFELLDSKSARPGFEADRAKLIPVITFYRGANLSALGRRDEAREAFHQIPRLHAERRDRFTAISEGNRRPLRAGAQGSSRPIQHRQCRICHLHKAERLGACRRRALDRLSHKVSPHPGAEEGVRNVHDERRARFFHRSVLEAARSHSHHRCQ